MQLNQLAFLQGFIEKISSELSEEFFAPGIPKARGRAKIPTVKKPETWDFTVHEHLARKAGKHFDIRLSDGERAYSFASRKGLPELGKKVLGVRQPDHAPSYMDWKGVIESGYGAGKVSIWDKGPVKVLESSPEKVKFVTMTWRNPEEFTMVRTKGDKWLLMNTSPTNKTYSHIPQDRPKYKDVPKDQALSVFSDDYAIQPKLDGANILLDLTKDQPRLFSSRPSSTSDALLQHTYRVKAFDKLKTPAAVKGSIVRGELYGVDRETGVAIPARELSGILNSAPAKAREKIKERNIELRTAIFDVEKYKGKSTAETPYREKLDILKKIEKHLPVHVPETALTSEQKGRLWEKLQKGEIPETGEGLVAWNLNLPQSPSKLKIRPDWDLYVRDIYEGTGKYKGSAGGFSYSLTPKGATVGNVGTGLTDEERKDMWEHPRRYLGRVARVYAMEQFPDTGALRAPSFGNWHMDK